MAVIAWEQSGQIARFDSNAYGLNFRLPLELASSISEEVREREFGDGLDDGAFALQEFI
jgi:hypothetical protein